MSRSSSPCAKIAAKGYRFCPHCNLHVAERTYRFHRAAFFPDGFVKPVDDSDSTQVNADR